MAIAWIGFDQPRKLGNNETGSVAALPIWMNYAAKALRSVEETFQEVPAGIVSVNVNPDTGQISGDGKTSEFFYQENIPAAQKRDGQDGSTRSAEEVKSQLF